MSNLFFVLLLLASVIALIVGLMRPQWVRMPSRKRAAMVYSGLAVVFFVLVAITVPAAPTVVAPIIATSSSVAITDTASVAATTSSPAIAAEGARDTITSPSGGAIALATLAKTPPTAKPAVAAQGGNDDISSPSDDAVALAALQKTPTNATPPTVASGEKAGAAYLYPNPTLTPGAVLTTDAATICAAGYASSVRNVSVATKTQVYAEYGVSYPQATGAYEVDHFIPLEIGGSNDIKNLWLEPASPTPGFHQKDQFEDYEHAQICKGIISVQEAQNRMVSDWYAYWLLEIGSTTNATPTAQTVAPAPAPQPITPQPATASTAAFYTSSYGTSKYYYPASCTAWQRLSASYLVSFDTLQALLAAYPNQTLSPSCQ